MKSVRWAVLALVLTASTAGCIGQTQTPGDPASETVASDATRNRSLSWAEASEAVVRPGVNIAGGCTANFIFRSPDNRSLYIGTAAHCFNGPTNETTTELNETVAIAGGRAEGRLAFVGYRQGGPADNASHDFALVEVAAEDRGSVYPGMYGYDGPRGFAEGVTVGDTVRTFGNSSLRDGADGLDARNGTVTDSRRQGDGTVRAIFRPPSIPGDSGSPVITASGDAIGTLVTINGWYIPIPPSDDQIPSVASNGIGWLPWSLEHVRETSDLEPILVTVPGKADR